MPKAAYAQEEWEPARKLGHELARRRNERGLKLTTLEEESGVRYAALRGILAGRSAGPSFFAVGAIASACGASLDELYRRSTSEGAEPESNATYLLIGQVVARMARHLQAALALQQLSIPQYRILVLLSQGSRMSPAELADSLGVSRPTISSVIDGLVGRGLVDRHPDPEDGRRQIIRFTRLGRDALESANEAIEGRVAEICGYLAPEQIAAAVAMVTQWEGALDRRRDDWFATHAVAVPVEEAPPAR